MNALKKIKKHIEKFLSKVILYSILLDNMTSPITANKPDSSCKVHMNQLYTFNVSPSDTYQYESGRDEKYETFTRLKKFQKYWNNLFKEFSVADVQYYLQTELSEPYSGNDKLQSSRLHFHGYIAFPNREALLWFHLDGSVLLAKTCRFEIDTIADPQIWYDYVHKQAFLELPVITNTSIDDLYTWFAGDSAKPNIAPQQGNVSPLSDGEQPITPQQGNVSPPPYLRHKKRTRVRKK